MVSSTRSEISIKKAGITFNYNGGRIADKGLSELDLWKDLKELIHTWGDESSLLVLRPLCVEIFSRLF